MTNGTIQPVNGAIERVITIVDQIIELSERENAELARGYPPTLAATTRRKRELATEFELWLAFVRDEHLVVEDGDPDLRAALHERMSRLDRTVGENMNRIEAALEARAARIEAVMRAIRVEVGQRQTGYGADGRAAPPRPTGAAVAAMRA